MTTSTTTHEEARRWMALHFAGEISVANEVALRTHLPDCGSCRARYERHLLLARLDRRALSAPERLARGLGLEVASPRRGWPTRVVMVAAMATALLLVFRSHRTTPAVPEGLAARGEHAESHAYLWVYRVSDKGPPQLADRHLAPDDDVAFAYANPAGKRYLSVFAVDEHAHVYWYYPAWAVGTPAPSAVPAQPGPGPHELPEAVRHAFDGRHVAIYALFSDEPLAVEALERRVVPHEGGAEVMVPPGALLTRRSFEVGR